MELGGSIVRARMLFLLIFGLLAVLLVGAGNVSAIGLCPNNMTETGVKVGPKDANGNIRREHSCECPAYMSLIREEMRCVADWNDAYGVGQKDVSDCKPMNADGFCSAADREHQAICKRMYRSGYNVSCFGAMNLLRQAFAKGQEQRGQNNPRMDYSVDKPCGVHWIAAYNQGKGGHPFKADFSCGGSQP